jgi:GGDEF domain-containing protein
MQDLSVFDAWCRDPRSMTFGEFLDELHRQKESGAPVSPLGLEMARSDLFLECRRRIDNGERFAMGYVHLHHFKEYSERYGRDRSTGVISLVDRIVRDLVRSRCRAEGFVAQIGKAAFSFVVSIDAMLDVCGQVLEMFDNEIPLQYDARDSCPGAASEQHADGQSQRIPLMEMKIGVVTNVERTIIHPAQMTELAMEIATYALSHPGSVFVVDRRVDAAEG